MSVETIKGRQTLTDDSTSSRVNDHTGGGGCMCKKQNMKEECSQCLSVTIMGFIVLSQLKTVFNPGIQTECEIDNILHEVASAIIQCMCIALMGRCNSQKMYFIHFSLVLWDAHRVWKVVNGEIRTWNVTNN